MPDKTYGTVRAGNRIRIHQRSSPCVTRRNPKQPIPPVRLAEMHQPVVRTKVRAEIAKPPREAAGNSWPCQGDRAV